ncbi:MAG: DUF1214 domain-containing protein [Pseudaminobacter sp.]
MFRTVLLTALILVIAIGGGASSVWYALDRQDGIDALSIGGWTAFPDIGTPDADPYSQARTAREGILTLGRAEGISFIAHHDTSGDRLRQDCSYRIEGNIPPARFWTLYAADAALSALRAQTRRPFALHSYEILRGPENIVSISVGRHPTPGNWLMVTGSGPMLLVLTLYDTSIASSTGVADVDLPRVTKVACDA